MMAKLERSTQPARMEAVSRDALVQAALQEINQNYREASLSNVARAYGVSLAYVSECVRAQTGRTYKELLQKHRMETAARLLRRSDLNIQQIIAQVGYPLLVGCPRPPCFRPAHGGLSLPQNGEKSGALWKIVLY